MVLTPFTEALQLRPSMAHVDAAAGKGGKGGAVEAESPEEEEDVKPQLQPVKVHNDERLRPTHTQRVSPDAKVGSSIRHHADGAVADVPNRQKLIARIVQGCFHAFPHALAHSWDWVMRPAFSLPALIAFLRRFGTALDWRCPPVQGSACQVADCTCLSGINHVIV